VLTLDGSAICIVKICELMMQLDDIARQSLHNFNFNAIRYRTVLHESFVWAFYVPTRKNMPVRNEQQHRGAVKVPE
jgi:hypothetical protein